MLRHTTFNASLRGILATLLTVGVMFTSLDAAAACRGAWAEGVNYAAGDTVTYNGSVYTARTAHGCNGCGWNPVAAPSLWSLGGTCSTTPTPTPTPTPTATPTPTVRPTVTPTVRPTVTPTVRPTATPTTRPTPTPTATPTTSPCNPAWSASAVYTGGQRVTHNGVNYEAKWWTQGNDPSTNSCTDCVWRNIGNCGTTTPTPTVRPTVTPTVRPTVTPTVRPTPTPTPNGRYRFAPYIDTSAGTDFNNWATATGGRYVSLAFYNSNGGCAGVFSGNEDSLLTMTQSLRQKGGDVIISSGGWNANDLAARCTDPAQIAAAYKRILDKFGTDYLDLDPEAGDANNNLIHSISDRRNDAIKLLQTQLAAAGRTLHLSYTLGVSPDGGFNADNLYVMQSAVARGVTVEVVNPMIMDYYDGVSGNQMGQRSILALQKVVAQLRSIYPGRSDAQLWSMMAATAMIGQNDNPTEVFTLQNAQEVLAFARQQGMARLTFWSLGRDNGGCAGNTTANWQCSGISQNQWDFSNIFDQF
jgi:hypothetical protein